MSSSRRQPSPFLRQRPRHGIRTVAVLGAGIMGSQLAAHIANAGAHVRLFDVDAAAARAGLEKAAGRHPRPFFTHAAQRLVTFGSVATELHRLSEADWILEAVTEDLRLKRELLALIDGYRSPGTPISTNTSSLSVSALSDDRSGDFKRCWMGTHFFNPPRYLHLVELVRTPDTDPLAAARVARFCDVRLGKGLVAARDTPGFIANRIGIFDTLQALRALEGGHYSIEDIDRMSGPMIGRPTSATFRMLDIVGIDVVASAIESLRLRLDGSDERERFLTPPVVGGLLSRGWIGDKCGRGFYAYSATADDRTTPPDLVLDPATFTYKPRQAAVPATHAPVGPAELRNRFLGRDQIGAYLRATIGRTLHYAAVVGEQIAESTDDIDRAMRWGFGWLMGPFEMWEAIGVSAVAEAIGLAGPPPLVAARIARRAPSAATVAAAGEGSSVGTTAGTEVTLPRPSGAGLTPAGRLIAMEDTWHATLSCRAGSAAARGFIGSAIEEASQQAEALVISLDGTSSESRGFVEELLPDVRARNWEAIDRRLQDIQRLGRAVHDAEIPIVFSIKGRIDGDACALALQAGRVQALAELRLGLIEVSLGLVPANGGLATLVARALRHAKGDRPDLVAALRPVFELVGNARLSTSAPHARELGLLRPRDGITMNADRLTQDALAVARLEGALWRATPTRTRRTLAGGATAAAALWLGVHQAWRGGRLSDHDARVARTLATVLAGGTSDRMGEVAVDQVLDLEREAFLSLCGEPLTLARLEHFASTGRLLKN